MPPGGYFGRALVVEAGSGTSSVLPLDDEVLRGYLGGAGLGAWLMHRLAPPGADPLGAQAPLAFVFSPLLAPLWALLHSDRFQAAVTDLGGYSTKEMGRRLQ